MRSGPNKWVEIVFFSVFVFIFVVLVNIRLCFSDERREGRLSESEACYWLDGQFADDTQFGYRSKVDGRKIDWSR